MLSHIMQHDESKLKWLVDIRIQARLLSMIDCIEDHFLGLRLSVIALMPDMLCWILHQGMVQQIDDLESLAYYRLSKWVGWAAMSSMHAMTSCI